MLNIISNKKTKVGGSVKPGFEKVLETFEYNFKKRNELGASCAVYHEGEKVVDLWGGYSNRLKTRPWEKDTSCIIFSSSKGFSCTNICYSAFKGTHFI